MRGRKIMSQELKDFQSRTETSLQNLSNGNDSSATGQPPALTVPSAPRKLDEAYYELQNRLEGKDAEFKKERFVYIFAILVLFDGLMLEKASGVTSFFFLVSTLVFAIAAAKWLEFPWIVTDLEVWHNRIGKWWDKKYGGGDEIEPE